MRDGGIETRNGLQIARAIADDRQTPGQIGQPRQCFDQNVEAFARNDGPDRKQPQRGAVAAGRERSAIGCRVTTRRRSRRHVEPRSQKIGRRVAGRDDLRVAARAARSLSRSRVACCERGRFPEPTDGGPTPPLAAAECTQAAASGRTPNASPSMTIGRSVGIARSRSGRRCLSAPGSALESRHRAVRRRRPSPADATRR